MISFETSAMSRRSAAARRCLRAASMERIRQGVPFYPLDLVRPEIARKIWALFSKSFKKERSTIVGDHVREVALTQRIVPSDYSSGRGALVMDIWPTA
jgi:hypothetical protein